MSFARQRGKHALTQSFPSNTTTDWRSASLTRYVGVFRRSHRIRRKWMGRGGEGGSKENKEEISASTMTDVWHKQEEKGVNLT